MSRTTRGFTLVELVLVMIVISVGAVGMTRLFGNMSKSLSANEILQQATQYAQQCAEAVLATQRDQGFSWFASNTFSCGNNPTNFTVTTNPVGALYTGTNVGPCPNGVSCRTVAITARSTVNTSLFSSVAILLVDYP